MIEYYECFMKKLYSNLGERVPVWGISHAGHVQPPTGNQQLYSKWEICLVMQWLHATLTVSLVLNYCFRLWYWQLSPGRQVWRERKRKRKWPAWHFMCLLSLKSLENRILLKSIDTGEEGVVVVCVILHVKRSIPGWLFSNFKGFVGFFCAGILFTV